MQQRIHCIPWLRFETEILLLTAQSSQKVNDFTTPVFLLTYTMNLEHIK